MNPLLHYPDLSLALETFKTTHLQHRDICGVKVKHKNGDKWTMIDSQCQSKQIHGPISQHSFVFSEYFYWDGLDIITYSKDMNQLIMAYLIFDLLQHEYDYLNNNAIFYTRMDSIKRKLATKANEIADAISVWNNI